MTADRVFTRLIREDVERGESVAICRRGRPVTGSVPHSDDKPADPEFAAAYRRMMAQLEEGASLGALKSAREDLYDR